jgi:hypothetical protein
MLQYGKQVVRSAQTYFLGHQENNQDQIEQPENEVEKEIIEKHRLYLNILYEKIFKSMNIFESCVQSIIIPNSIHRMLKCNYIFISNTF